MKNRLSTSQAYTSAINNEGYNIQINELPRSSAVEVSKRNYISIAASSGVLNSFIPDSGVYRDK